MIPAQDRPKARRKSAPLFWAGFVAACLLFWWLPSILFRYVLQVSDPVENWVLEVSFLSVILFTAGYLLPPLRFRQIVSTELVDSCEGLAYKATWWLALPALLLAIQAFTSRSGVDYGEGQELSIIHQAVFYTHMFFAFMFLSAARKIPANQRKFFIVSLLMTLPRLIVSLRGGRFFLGQAVIPIVLLALSRGWLSFSAKRFLQLVLVAIFVVFVPSFTRGDRFDGQYGLVSFFEAGSSLRLFQDNLDIDLKGRCPPFFVSLTAKLIPYSLLGVCTMDIYGVKDMPATLDRILTDNDPSTEGTLRGTGGNYLLELYVTGGMAAIVIGSALFGFSSRCFLRWIADRSLFGGIWAECLSRILFAPRGDLSYVYERIPSLIATTLLIVAVVWIVQRHTRMVSQISRAEA